MGSQVGRRKEGSAWQPAPPPSPWLTGRNYSLLPEVQLERGLMLLQVGLQGGPRRPGPAAIPSPSPRKEPCSDLMNLRPSPSSLLPRLQSENRSYGSQPVHARFLLVPQGREYLSSNACVHTQAQCTGDRYVHTGQCTKAYMQMCIHRHMHAHSCMHSRAHTHLQSTKNRQRRLCLLGVSWQQRLPNPSPTKLP